MRPPFPYFGGKQSLAAAIAALLPEHEHYVEPFAGSLAVLLAKPPSRMETVNDLDGDLMTFWRVLRDQPAELERVCALTPHSRAEHEHALATVDKPLSGLERARRVWVLLTQGRSARTARSAGWRHFRAPKTSSMPDYLQGYVSRMAAVADLYDRDLYADWHRLEIPTGTGNGGQWRDRTEVLWSNRPLGQQPALDFGEAS